MASIKFPTFPNVDFSNLEMPKFDMPKFDMPKFDLPNFDMPKFEMPAVDAEAVTNVVKDAAYVTIGLAVLGFQKAQVARRDLSKTVSTQFGSGKAQLNEVVDSIETQVSSIDARLAAFEAKLDVVLEDLEKRLPERAGSLLGSAHEAAKTARKQVRGFVTTAAA